MKLLKRIFSRFFPGQETEEDEHSQKEETILNIDRGWGGELIARRNLKKNNKSNNLSGNENLYKENID